MPPWGRLAALFGRQARARRGDVRSAILSLLAEQPRNGYQIMQELEARSQGTWRPSSGSVYPTLQQLEDEELVEPMGKEGKGGGGRMYQLTAEGKSYVASHREELAAVWEQAQESSGDPVAGSRFEMLGLFRQIAPAAMQVAQNGTPEQIEQAKALLAEVRRGLYRILAEVPDEDDDR